MSTLNFMDIHNKQHNKNIKKLYNEAFPKEERVPLWLLKILAKKENVKFYGIYDNEKFIGLSYNIYHKDIVFIFYLAIDSNLRGQGYGSKVLELIKQKYNNHRIILNIEEMDKNSKNYEQRIKRKEFYKRSGFYDLDFTVKEAGVVYETLCYNKDKKQVGKEEYMEFMKKYFGKILSWYVYKNISK